MVLQSIRERLTGVLAFVILGILVIPFALVGVTQYFTSDGANIVARVNDTEITTTDFNASFSDYRRRMQSILGAAYDPIQYDQLTVRREHLDNLIDQELITQAAASMGLDVDDETLAKEIRQIPGFQVEGQFNADVYQSRLAFQGMSPKQFENQMRSQFVVSQLPQNISMSSIVTPAELSTFVALRDQGRTFSAVMVPAVPLEIPPTFTEQEITEWYETNADEFQSEEQVIVEYVELDATFLPLGEAPSEDYLRDEFEVQKARFISPEQRKVSHILIEVAQTADDATKETARQTAQDLTDRARAGEDFAELAKEYSQDQGSAGSGGDLGWVEPGVMVKAFENAMYELDLDNPISDPVETGFGWHVIDLKEIQESTGMSFEEARQQLIREYEDEESSRAFLEQADRLVDLIYEDPTTLESAALDMGLEVKQAGPFTRSGGDGIAANPEVVEAAFSDLVLLQESVSDPVTLDEGRLVMVKLLEHLPQATRPLDEVRDEIVNALTEQAARDRAEATANELLAAYQSEEGDIETLALVAELEYSYFDQIQRNALVPDNRLVTEVFQLSIPAEGQSIEAVLPSTDGFAVIQLEKVTDGVIDEGAALAQQQYSRILTNSNASQEATGLIKRLRSEADVKVFEDRIK
jgi:peptidyl-prolyl cis-trans isomerase D